MAYKCKDRCRFEDRASQVGYYEGWRRCGNCEFNKETIKVFCYCCGQRYRIKPRDWQSRHRMEDLVKRN